MFFYIAIFLIGFAFGVAALFYFSILVGEHDDHE